VAHRTNVIGLEILVPRLADALTFFVDALGFDLAYRGPARDVSGEAAVLDGGTIAVTLLEPAESGPGLLSDRTPRVTQLVFGAAGESVLALAERMQSAGVATREHSDGRVFVPPDVAAGILGFEVALMFGPVEP